MNVFSLTLDIQTHISYVWVNTWTKFFDYQSPQDKFRFPLGGFRGFMTVETFLPWQCKDSYLLQHHQLSQVSFKNESFPLEYTIFSHSNSTYTESQKAQWSRFLEIQSILWSLLIIWVEKWNPLGIWVLVCLESHCLSPNKSDLVTHSS